MTQFNNGPGTPTFTKVNEYGQPGPLPGTDPAGAANSGNWEFEESLDVEWAHAIAPKASLVLVECNSTSNADLFTGAKTAAGLPGVVVVSMSFDEPEFAGEKADDSDFTTPAGHTGVTFVDSSGDYGAFGTGGDGDTSMVNYPAASPNVLAVGGTQLDAQREQYAE